MYKQYSLRVREYSTPSWSLMSTGSSQTGRLQQTRSPGAPAATALPLKSHRLADLMELEAFLADRGYAVPLPSPTRWTWTWARSGRWWWRGKPGKLQSMGSQRVRHDWATELNWTEVHRQLFGTITLFYVIQNFNEERSKNVLWDRK